MVNSTCYIYGGLNTKKSVSETTIYFLYRMRLLETFDKLPYCIAAEKRTRGMKSKFLLFRHMDLIDRLTDLSFNCISVTGQ